MATKGDEKATFSVVLDDQVSGPAEDAAKAVETLRGRMADEEATIKELSGALRKLRGNTEEVKNAKDQLKSKLNASRDALSASQLALVKNADAVKQLTAREKALKDARDASAKHLKDVHEKSVKQYNEKKKLEAKNAKELAEATAKQEEDLAKLGAVASATAAVFVALAVAIGAAVVSFTKFVVSGANAARTANLFREAAAGSASNATALGTQVEALANKVPTAKAALNELAISLAKGGVQGQTLVDTLNAVGQANAALGDDAGGKLRELVDRGRLSQRFYVNPLELQGSGLQFDDIAKELASSMHVGVDKARAALAEGRVKLGDGAAAMRAAVEKKFGGINLRRMLDLNVIIEKVHERLDAMTSGVNIEPLLKGFAKLAEIFDDETVTGDALKQLITFAGTNLVKALETTLPIAKKFFQGLIIGALTAGIMFLQLRNHLRKTFGDSEVLKGLDTMKIALEAGKFAVESMMIGVLALGAAIAFFAGPLYAVYKVVEGLGKVSVALGDAVTSVDWAGLGGSMIDGLINGLKAGAGRAVDAVKGLADKLKSGFRSALEIHSPSKAFERDGRQIPAGTAKGVEGGTADVTRAIDAMVPTPSASSSAGGVAGGRAPVSITVPVTINMQGGADVAKQVTEPGFIQQLVKAFEEAMLTAGIPVT
jgi:hypothetical protein